MFGLSAFAALMGASAAPQLMEGAYKESQSMLPRGQYVTGHRRLDRNPLGSDVPGWVSSAPPAKLARRAARWRKAGII